MRSVKIVRIIMLVAAFTLPLNAQQPDRDKPVLATAGARRIGTLPKTKPLTSEPRTARDHHRGVAVHAPVLASVQ